METITYLPQELIRIKRDKGELSHEQIAAFISMVNDQRMSDSQTASMAMAIFLNGMGRKETAALTTAMRDSGDVLEWPDATRPIIDKHSTGGVGDNVSLILAPLAASCGLDVPMISGRGLGHTGGTLDKLEAIPGYNATPDISKFRSVVKNIGCAIIAQTANLAPADKKIYAIRDITATVESVPLIVASILSKKLASGVQGLVLDVKCGNGSTTSDADEAGKLAQELVDVANRAGLPTSALVTDMNEPLASAIGNATEVVNAIEFLTGQSRDVRLYRVIIQLTAHMLMAGGITCDYYRAEATAQRNLSNGKAAELFGKMVHELGGPTDIVENFDTHLPKAQIRREIKATRSGCVNSYQTRALGMAIVALGGGRSHPSDKLDYSVGLSKIRTIGTTIEAGETLAMAHVNSDEQFDELSKRFNQACEITDSPAFIRKPILKKITASE